MKLLFVLLCLLLTGCSELHPGYPVLGFFQYTRAEPYLGEPIRVIPIWIDKDFGTADQIAIDDAIKQWNYVGNGYIVLKVVDRKFDGELIKVKEQEEKNGWLIMRINSLNSIVKNQATTLGIADELGGHYIYLVRDRLGNEDVMGVSLHEMGHLLLAKHSGNRLMSPIYSRAGFQCIDYETAKQVAIEQHIPISGINYCEE